MFEQPKSGFEMGSVPDPSATATFADHPQHRFEDVEMRFRTFVVLPGARVLLRDGNSICIGSRAFDLLVVLLRSRGLVVTKDEINRHVWPKLNVEESNLRFQVAALRRALGEDADLVKTIAGRGYLFAAEAPRHQNFGSIDGYLPLRQEVAREPNVDLPQDREAGCGDGANAELLDGFLRSAGMLMATYGSIEAFLGALAVHRR